VVIDSDPLRRKWIELSGANPERIAEYRPTLVAFLAYDRSRYPLFVGTGFVIAGNEHFALVATAKHVLQEGALRAQKPESASASTQPFSTSRSTTPSIAPDKLRAVWMGKQAGEMLRVGYVEYNDSLDVAICLVMPEAGTNAFAPWTVPLDISIPQVGDVVHMASLDRLRAYQTVAPQNAKGDGQTIKVETRVSLRMGKVTGVYQSGLRQYRWPCFTTTIPADPGMSGGLVTLYRPNQTVAAIGVVCADASSKSSHKNQKKPGESIIASTWPALSIQVPVVTSDSAPKLSLHEMMRLGRIEPAIGGIERLEVIDYGNGNRTIGFKD